MNLNTSILKYIEDVKSGTFTVEEFTAATLQRIKDVDGDVHAYLSLNDSAINDAKIIDKKISSGEKIGRGYGFPISIKDNICITGTKTTCASKILENFIAPYTSTVVNRLQNEDVVITGKTNLDEFAMGLTTEFSAFGPTKNPWNLKYVPGGSSGGSAASVAANECLASLGSDTGGSVRNPASFCSVVGLKPTYGLISRYGLISYANSIEQIGPMTKTVKDSAFLLNIIAGQDANDDTTINNNNVNYLENIEDGIEDKRIGIIKEMTIDGLSSEVATATKDAIKDFESLGASCDEVTLPTIPYTVAAYYTITSTEAGSNLARYDNIRYGYELESEGYEYNSYISKSRTKFGPEVTRRIILGGFVPSAGYAGKYFLKALKVKSKLTSEVNKAFENFDYLIAPTTPVQPFRFGEKIDDPVTLMLLDYNTVTANLTGKPAISVPYRVVNGLPIGMQIMGNSLEEKSLLQSAYALESKTNLPAVPL
ncbi:MAG: Asp-tRNA(Asn)/Glu-tRNA(Gln) amidotransferase subunit GatA [Crenarchaeota archaeon]|nr:Asp-tRNA(Asn)/Glu-tRNA(Gln) amidotransferase subunit GatA [Thermoproteota archaeon]MDA1124899.1 Asp-tRNA(Asn)/Glu-tRNA(Gln) amidotransferase subunit GatA [Thermoproteota archaeon]